MSTSHEPNDPNRLPPDYGLPPRPPTASTPLWTHFLRPNSQVPTSLADMPLVAPPLGPLDKNATSMRILLHDTQANFEKFTVHVGKLIDGIKETKHEMKTTHSLFERDRESLMGDIIDLVNRSQKEIQKSVGTPAQTESMDNFFKDVNHRLEGLDQRLDAIQAFNQTHSQALQTQIQAVQILLDKQGTIVAAVLPLLPLLQAVPLHIDSAKNSIKENVANLASFRKMPSNFNSTAENDCQVPPSNKSIGKRKRTHQEAGLASSSSSSPPTIKPASQKRLRNEDLSKDSASGPTNKLSKSDDEPLFFRQDPAVSSSSPYRPNVSRKNASGIASSSLSVLSPVGDRAPVSAMSTSGGRRGSFAIPTFTTPRRPLGELHISHTHSHRTPVHKTPSASSGSHGSVLARSSTSSAGLQLQSAPVFLGITPTAARPPRMLRVHTSIANNTKNQSGSFSSAGNGTATNSTYVKAGPLEDASRQNVSSPNHVITSYLGLRGPGISGDSRSGAEPLQMFNSRPMLAPDASKEEDITIRPPSQAGPSSTILGDPVSHKPKSQNIPLAVALGKMKERRSPVKKREGRRFIPLLDSEEEDED